MIRISSLPRSGLCIDGSVRANVIVQSPGEDQQRTSECSDSLTKLLWQLRVLDDGHDARHTRMKAGGILDDILERVVTDTLSEIS